MQMRISADVEETVVENIDAVLASLGLPDRAAFVLQAVQEKLGQVPDDRSLIAQRDKAFEARDNANVEATDARQQRNQFKMMMEAAKEDLVIVESKLAAYEQQPWWERLLGIPPKFEFTARRFIHLETLVLFRNRLRVVGFTTEQIDTILKPLKPEIDVSGELSDDAIEEINDTESES